MDTPTATEIKALEREDLEYILGPSRLALFKTKPMTHQLASIVWALFRNSAYFLHDIGTGKTLSALYTIQCWDVDRVLVVCPCSVRKTWADEVQKHTSYSYAMLEGTSETRKDISESDFSKFHVINYEGLKHLFGKKVPIKGKKGESARSKYVPDLAAIDRSPYDCVIADEAHRCKSFSAIQTAILYHIARRAKKAILLTGSPIAKDIRDFWSEFMVLDNGKTLGDNEFVFLHTYMNRVEIKARKHHFYEWFPKKGSVEDVSKKVSQSAIRYDASECFDLPELVQEKRYIDIGIEQQQITHSILEDLKIDLKEGKLTIKNVLNKTIKLAQIASGFVLGDDQKPIFFKANPKLDELIELITTEIRGQCIVFHNFVACAHQIEERFKKEGITFRASRGETKDKMQQIDNFQKDPSIKVFLAHPLSGGEGLNLQNAATVIFYDQIFAGATLREQCIGRVRRKGQQQTCIVVDLLIYAPGTKKESIDERIYNIARGKKELAQGVLDWLRDN